MKWSRLVLVAVALVTASGVRARAPGQRGPQVQEIGNLRFVNIPRAPLKPSWKRAGLDLSSLAPATMLNTIRSTGALGQRVLAEVAGSGYQKILVVFMDSARVPQALRREMRAIGVRMPVVRFKHSTMAAWTSVGPTGLILLRVDRIVSKRNRGFAHYPVGSLAHELVHVAQSSWGALDRWRRKPGLSDVFDETEAWMLARLVDHAEVRRRARGILNEGETRLLANPPRANRQSMRAMLQKLAKGPYSKLPKEARYDGARYRKASDPFAALW